MNTNHVLIFVIPFYFTKKTPDFSIPRKILGQDFISPEEIAAARGLSYSAEQITELERTLPDRETLEWLRRHEYYLVAGPPCEMSLLDVRELVECRYFYNKYGGWWAHKQETFARIEKVSCRWYMLRKSIVPNSTHKRWSTQQGMLSCLETVPTAVELVWGVTCYKAVRGVYLLPSVYARISSVDSSFSHVGVGFNGVGGLDLRPFNYLEHYSVGVVSSRKSVYDEP